MSDQIDDIEYLQPEMFGRSTLLDTTAIVDKANPKLGDILREILQRLPLDKPLGSTNDADLFLVSLALEDSEQVFEILFDAEADAVMHGDGTTPNAKSIGDLADKWNRYCQAKR